MKWLFKAVTAGILSLAILSAFDLIYSFSGIHIANSSGATDYTWQPGQPKSNMTEGFSWLLMDENGFRNNKVPSESSVNILMMGSSHMEALNVSKEEDCTSLLSEALPEMSVYNIGMSGHTLYRCIDNAEAACGVYSPSDFLILETDTVALSEEEMSLVLSGNAAAIPSYDSGLLFYLQKIPAIKWIYKQCTDWISLSEKETASPLDSLEDSFPEETTATTVLSSEYQDTLSSFLGKLQEAAGKTGCQAVIFYHPPASAAPSGEFLFSTDPVYLKAFADACAMHDILFLDMTEDFASLYQEQRLFAHGFSNTAVGSGHLNRYGHELIARRLFEIIQNVQKESLQ